MAAARTVFSKIIDHDNTTRIKLPKEFMDNFGHELQNGIDMTVFIGEHKEFHFNVAALYGGHWIKDVSAFFDQCGIRRGSLLIFDYKRNAQFNVFHYDMKSATKEAMEDLTMLSTDNEHFIIRIKNGPYIPLFFFQRCIKVLVLDVQEEDGEGEGEARVLRLGINEKDDKPRFTKNWSVYVNKNNLKSDDVCIFELKPGGVQPSLGVTIYRNLIT